MIHHSKRFSLELGYSHVKEHDCVLGIWYLLGWGITLANFPVRQFHHGYRRTWVFWVKEQDT